MPDASNPINLSDNDLREIFSLFTSVTTYERELIYDSQSEHNFLRIDLYEEYSLTQEAREYALDAWRAVVFFLHSKGYKLYREGQVIDLSFSNSEFID